MPFKTCLWEIYWGFEPNGCLLTQFYCQFCFFSIVFGFLCSRSFCSFWFPSNWVKNQVKFVKSYFVFCMCIQFPFRKMHMLIYMYSCQSGKKTIHLLLFYSNFSPLLPSVFGNTPIIMNCMRQIGINFDLIVQNLRFSSNNTTAFRRTRTRTRTTAWNYPNIKQLQATACWFEWIL